MKWFWVFILVLLAFAVWMLYGRVGSGAGSSTSPPQVSTVDPTQPTAVFNPKGEKTPARPIANAPVAEAPSPEPTLADGAASGVRPVPQVPGLDATPSSTPSPVDQAKALPELAPATSPTVATTSASPETMRSISEDIKLIAGTDELSITPGLGGPAPVSSNPDNSNPIRNAKPAAAGTTDAQAKEAKIIKQDDGSMLVDDRFLIRGSGTQADPYRITWELLVSSEESYQPRLGRKIIPARVQMLHEKWVRISGFIAFPIMAQSPDEMLMMLNQWDGCCIGVPPTPYDAIEVKLKKAAVGDERLRTSAAITGILKVDPFLVRDWLVSLYLLDDGILSDTAGQAAPAGMHKSQQ